MKNATPSWVACASIGDPCGSIVFPTFLAVPNKTDHSVGRVSTLLEDCSEYEGQVLLAMLVFMKSALK